MMTDEEIKAIKEILDFHKKQILSQFSKDVPDTNVGDTISRQAAINALREHRALYCDNTPDTFSKLSYAEKCRVDELDTAIATLVNLPSAQRKGKWIHGIEISREYLADETIHIEYKDYHCSECGYTVANIRWNVVGELVDKYCTVCGAQMEVEE